jgi:hypothetical protein
MGWAWHILLWFAHGSCLPQGGMAMDWLRLRLPFAGLDILLFLFMVLAGLELGWLRSSFVVGWAGHLLTWSGDGLG